MSNTDQYMGMFLAEMEEQIEMLNQEVLALEKHKEDTEVINNLFRIAHTLKGSSATMGFHMIADLTHKMENILDDVRKNKLQVKVELIDIIFACLDKLQVWRDKLAAGDDDLESANELIEKLALIQNGETKEIKNTAEISIAKNALDKAQEYVEEGWWVGALEVKIDPACIMQGVRAFMAFNKAKELGEVLFAAPEPDDLSESEYEGNLVLYVALQNEDEMNKLKDSLLSITDIDDVIVTTNVKPTNENPIPVKGAEEARKQTAATAISEKKEKTSQEPKKHNEGNDYLRIEVGKLDVLMNLLGELVIDRARLEQIGIDIEKTHGSDTTEGLSDVTRHISHVTGELQECLLKLRMSPVSLVYNRLPRIVRDLSHNLGKEVNLILEGEETELDRTVIQNIFEPLIHLIRNSMDHGLEVPEERKNAGKPVTGELLVKAEQVGGEILITVKDDGKGINPEIIRQAAIEKGMVNQQEANIAKDADVLQWIFEPGFSTRKEVSEVSGRGVGMDVVRHKIEELQGRIQLESEVSKGTTIRITLPLTLAVVRALLVDVAGDCYTIPLANVLETLRAPKEEIYQLATSPAIVVRGRTIPLINMLEWSKIDSNEEESNYVSIVLVSSGSRQAGLIVSSFIGEQEVVVKPLDKYLGRLQGFAGATLLGDGRVSLIYDIPSLLNSIDMFFKGVN